MMNEPDPARERATASPVWFIGDWVTAMGYRLAGAAVLSPPLEDTLAALQQAVSEGARVVLLCAENAAAVDAKALAERLSRRTPLLLIVPDARGRGAVYDVPARVRSGLGSEL